MRLEEKKLLEMKKKMIYLKNDKKIEELRLDLELQLQDVEKQNAKLGVQNINFDKNVLPRLVLNCNRRVGGKRVLYAIIVLVS